MPAICAFPKDLKCLAFGCKIERRPDPAGIAHDRTSVFLATPDVSGVFSPFNHHACQCNELIAIHNRVCGEVPEPTELGLRELRVMARTLAQCLPEITPEDYGVLPTYYSGKKAQRYAEATTRCLEIPITRSEARVTMFIKNEKLSPAKVNPDPRAIQFRDARYCVEVARFLKPIEKHLYNLSGGDLLGLPPTRLIGKGLNQVERAKLLRKKMARFSQPMVVSLDMSRFDQHVSRELLEIEHSVYVSCCPDPFFAELLSWQLDNIVYTRSGYKYRTRGKRMSGDMNTALGNCVIMIVMVCAFMKHHPCQWDLLDDGDDCLLIVNNPDLPWVLENAQKIFLNYGHEVKIEKVAREMAAVSWCQCAPIEYQFGKWKFVRDPIKAMSNDLVGPKWATSTHGRARLLATIGLCELILNIGVPVLQEYSLALLRSAGDSRPYTDGEFFTLPMALWAQRELRVFGLKHIARLKPQAITDEARVSFATAFGISVDEQLLMETQLRDWVIRLDGDVRFWDAPRDSLTWEETRPWFPERYL